jgi:hypothetical protein
VSGLEIVLAGFGMGFDGLDGLISEIVHDVATRHGTHRASGRRRAVRSIAGHEHSFFGPHMRVVSIHLFLGVRINGFVNIEDSLRYAGHSP